MPEYYTADGDLHSGDSAADAAGGRPDAWVPAVGVAPLGAVPARPATVQLTWTVTLEDMMASVLGHPATLKRYEQHVRKAGWRRGLRTLPITLGLVLLANIFMLDVGIGWSVLSTVLLGGLFAVVLWSQIDHSIKRRLPAVLEKQALHDLAQHGDQRLLVADPAGVTLADAVRRHQFGWDQVHLTETDRYVIVTSGSISWAVPKRLGQPLADLVQFARGQGAA